VAGPANEHHRPSASATSSTLGFLFADLRGFTDFVDRYGASASAELLTRYRAIVRGVMARHDGSEIKTEGDSFYVVFPSASRALRAAIELRSACAVPDDGPPMPVGIGLHAGEAVPLDGNYVGSAVNIAARICAVAGRNEVVASETVRELTRSVVPAAWQSLGERQLKGIGERVRLFRYQPASEGSSGGTAFPRPASRSRAVIFAAVGVAAIVGAVALASSLDAGLGLSSRSASAPSGSSAISAAPNPSATATPDPTARPLPLSDGLAPHVTTAPGHYVTTAFQPSVEFVLSTGWEATADEPDVLELRRQTQVRGAPDGLVTFSRIRAVFDPPCPKARTSTIGQAPADLIAWVSSRPYLVVSEPVPLNAAGLGGLSVDARARSSTGPGCRNRPEGFPDAYYLFPQGSSPFFIDASERVRIEVFELPSGAPLTVIVEATPDRLPAVQHEVDSLLLTTSVVGR